MLDIPGARPDDARVAGAAARRTLDVLLEDARARIERVEPVLAHAALEEGVILIDIRDDAARERDGIVPGSLHVPRTVLEWRLAPDSPWRNPYVGALDARILLLCDHGCSSILAAATLVDLGLSRTGDVIGGFEAWRDAGLPVVAAPADGRPAELPGMGRPA